MPGFAKAGLFIGGRAHVLRLRAHASSPTKRTMSPRFSAILGLIGSLWIGASPVDAQALANLEASFSPSLTLTYNTIGKTRVLQNSGEETSTDFVSFTVGARDILGDLIYNGRIAGPLTGWKLVARATSDEAVGLRYRLYAVKTGQPDYPLETGGLDALDLGPSFIITKIKEVLYGDGHYTGSGTIRYYTSGTFAFATYNLYLAGNTSVPYSYKMHTVGADKLSVVLPGTVEAKVNGGQTFEAENASVLAAGSLKFSSHRILSVAP
jgi:hypothetical protein